MTTPTNGVKAALRFPSITSGTNFSEFQIQIVVSSASINRIRIWMPPENQLLRLDLLDSKGKPVQKTSRGKRLNSPLAIQPRPLDRQGFRTVLAQKNEMSSVTWFRLSDFFEDAPDGNYVLHSSATVCVDEHAPNHQPVAFVLPDIRVNIIK